MPDFTSAEVSGIAEMGWIFLFKLLCYSRGKLSPL